jgi:outer membrane protein assembly factor BamB
LFVIAAVIVIACGQVVANSNWPAASSHNDIVYLAYGPQVVALDLNEEQALWSFPQEANPRQQFYASPSVQDGRIVIGDYGAAGGLITARVSVTAYGLEEAEQAGLPRTLWANDGTAHDRIIAPPLQVGNTAFVTTADGFVYALDAETGQPLWEVGFQADNAIWGQPAYEDGTLYVAAMDGALHALDAESGEVKWSQSFDGALSSRPTLGGSLIYVSSFDRNVYALSKQSGEIVWSAPAEAALWAGPVLSDNLLYYVDLQGNLYAVDSATGAPVWPEPVRLAEFVTATPVLSDGVLYIGTGGSPNVEAAERRGTVRALSAENGSELWASPAPAPVQTQLVVTDTRVAAPLLSAEAILVVFDRLEGDQVWSYLPPSAG